MKNIKYIAAAFLFSGMVYAQNIDINAMPKPGPTPAINIAKPNSFKLKNGLTVLVVENNKLPRLNIQLTMDRPPIYEGNIVGVGEIMADQLGTGTTKLSKEEFNKKIKLKLKRKLLQQKKLFQKLNQRLTKLHQKQM